MEFNKNLNSPEPLSQFLTKLLHNASLGEGNLNLIVPLKGPTSFQMEIIMKYQKYIDEI